jgi:hypothetical protein
MPSNAATQPKRDQPVFWPSGEVIFRGKWTGATWMWRIRATHDCMDAGGRATQEAKAEEQLPRGPFEP